MQLQATVDGETRRVGPQAGWLALAFFPPLAGAELAPFEAAAPAFAAQGATLVAVTVDPWYDRRETAVATSLPLVSDGQGTLARRYGALADGEGRFGTVLLAPDGRPFWDDLGRGPSAERALRALREARGLRPAA